MVQYVHFSETIGGIDEDEQKLFAKNAAAF